MVSCPSCLGRPCQVLTLYHKIGKRKTKKSHIKMFGQKEWKIGEKECLYNFRVTLLFYNKI